MRATAARMKRKYDDSLRRHREIIKPGDIVFLRDERKDETDTRHKLAAVAEGPFRVDSVKGNTVVIEYHNAKVERLSRDRVTLAPKSLVPEEIAKILGPITDAEIVPSEFPIPQDVNLRDFLTPRDDTAVTPLSQRAISGYTDQQDSTPVDISRSNRELNQPRVSISDRAAQPPAIQSSTHLHTGPRPSEPAEPCPPNSTTADSSDESAHSGYDNLFGGFVTAEANDCDAPPPVLTEPEADTTSGYNEYPERQDDDNRPKSRTHTAEPPTATAEPTIAPIRTAGRPAIEQQSVHTSVPTPPHPPVLPESDDTAPDDTVPSHSAKCVRFAERPTVCPEHTPDTHSSSFSTPHLRELHSSALSRDVDPLCVAKRPRRSRQVPTTLRDGINASPTKPTTNPRGGSGLPSASWHGVNDNPCHPSEDLNESMFRVRWTDYGSKDDTFEPIHHVPRNAVVSYCNWKGLALPHDLGRSQAG